MRRLLIFLFLAALFASALTGAGLSANSPAKGPLVFKVRLIQEATYRHPHPPNGDPESNTLYELIHTLPAFNSEATRCARWMSRVHTAAASP